MSEIKNSEALQSGKLSTHRREFLKKSGAMAVMSAFGVGFFTSCSNDDSPGRTGTPPVASTGITVSGSVITVNLDIATGLATPGGWALVSSADVLIVNLGNNNFSALTAICTHRSCNNSWSFSDNVFRCSCHGSRFTATGAVVNGPANQPLRSFPTELINNTLLVNFG